jgi:hypothetical protein
LPILSTVRPKNSFEYNGIFSVALKARLYQQLVQIFCSILFAVIEYLIVKHQIVESICICSYSKKNVKCSYTGSELSFHINPQPYGIFSVQFFTTILGLICLSIGTFFLFFGPVENAKVMGFAMTGLGSPFLYMGREFQRSVLRVARLDQHNSYDEGLLENFESRDRIYRASFFSACLALGELFAILLMRFSPITVAMAAFCPIATLISVLWLCVEICPNHRPRKFEFGTLKSLNNFFAKDTAKPSYGFSFRKQRSTL